MAVVGLWHGAGWTFILWGLLHGAYLSVYRLYESTKASRPGFGQSVLVTAGWRLFTLVAITAAWVPFRAPSLHKATDILSSMFIQMTAGRAYSPAFYLFTAAVMVLCMGEPFLGKAWASLEGYGRENDISWLRVFGRPIVYTFGIVLFMLFDQHNAQFIYSQF
jgi:hypothetical protein